MNDLLMWATGAGVMAAVLGVFLIVQGVLDRRRARLEARLDRSRDEESGVLVRRIEAERNLTASAKMDRSFDQMIGRTGLDVQPAEALGYMFLAAVTIAGIFYLIRGEVWLLPFGFLLGMGSVLGIYLIYQARYKRTLQDQLPETFHLIASSLRAGMSLDQAIMVVGEHGVKPLSKEFSRAAGQIALGLPVAAAVEIMARRLRLLDLDIFASTVAMYQTSGGNLPLLLDRLAQGARDRSSFRNYLRSATALSRTTAIFFLGFVPVMLIGYALFQPEHIQSFFTTAAGWTMLAVAFGLQLIGALIIFRMLKIEL